MRSLCWAWVYSRFSGRNNFYLVFFLPQSSVSLLSSRKTWRLIWASSIHRWKCSHIPEIPVSREIKALKECMKEQSVPFFTPCSAPLFQDCSRFGTTGISKTSPAFCFPLLSLQEKLFSGSLSRILLDWDAQTQKHCPLLGPGMGWSKQQGTTPAPVPGPSSVPVPLPSKSCCLTNPSCGISEGWNQRQF